MSNWESWGNAPFDPNGNETIPGNHNGVSGYTTINKIKDFIVAAINLATTISDAIAAHLTAYDHDAISHTNRSALNLVEGVNTGDQDLSGLAPINSPVFTGDAEFVNDMTLNGIRVGTGAGDMPSNICFGEGALDSNTTGTYNMAIGAHAVADNMSSNYLLGIGAYALHQATGGDNLGVGYYAGYAIITGLSNTFIGNNAGAGINQVASVVDSIAIGAGSYTTKNNQAVFGNNTITETLLRGNVITPALSVGMVVNTTSTLTVALTTTSIIANYKGTTILTLPNAANFTGRVLMVRTVNNNDVISASSDVVSLAGGVPGTAILAATAGKWAMLQSDGTNWQIMMAN